MAVKYQVFGNYMLLEKLSSDGKSEVNLARSKSPESSNSFFAIKKISANHKNELRIIKNLKHKNIVTFYDPSKTQNSVYLIMEYINGKNLNQLTNDLNSLHKSISLELILYLVAEIAAGLDHVHRCKHLVSNEPLNIIHNDINPANIMISYDGSVKIIDFGKACLDFKNKAMHAELKNSQSRYISPEQIAGHELTLKSDIFSLGSILWELLTKKSFNINNEALSLVNENSEATLELEKIVRKALAINPTDRYETCSDLQHELNKYLILNFPNFRPHHFIHFISSFYSLVIHERTNKLQNYSKIKLVGTIKNRSDEIVEFSPVNRYDMRDEASKIKQSENDDFELPDGFGSKSQLYKSVQKRKSESHSDHQFDQLNKKNPFAGDVKFYTKQKAAVFYANERLQESDENTKPSIYRSLMDISYIGNFKHLIVLTLFLITLFLGYNYIFETKSPEATNVVSLSSEAENTVEINQPTQFRKPLIIDDFSKSIYQKLKATSKLAYVNIYVMNSNPNVRIYVNNRELIEKSPIRAYPIYANTVTKISAYDSKTKLYSEKKITVIAGKVINLQLYLQPYTVRNQ